MPAIVHGLKVDPFRLTEARDYILKWMGKSKPYVVVCWNANYLVRAQTDGMFREAVNQCDLRLCDGVPVLWMARVMGVDLPERVAGPDLLTAVMDNLGLYRRIFVVGGNEPATRAYFARVAPHTVLQVYSPPRAQFDKDRLIHMSWQLQPELTLIAMGEVSLEVAWFLYARDIPGVLFPVGGALDMVTGVTPRAPEWMQRAGVEWLYRMSQEPRRLYGRYAHDAWPFATLFARALLGRLCHGRVRDPRTSGPLASVPLAPGRTPDPDRAPRTCSER